MEYVLHPSHRKHLRQCFRYGEVERTYSSAGRRPSDSPTFIVPPRVQSPYVHNDASHAHASVLWLNGQINTPLGTCELWLIIVILTMASLAEWTIETLGTYVVGL